MSGTPRKEMATRDLVCALEENVNVVVGELCSAASFLAAELDRPHTRS
ncbi:hypothetical protein [Streptomyces sp. NPDC001880]